MSERCEWCMDKAKFTSRIGDKIKYFCEPHFNLATNRKVNPRSMNRAERRKLRSK